MKTKGFTLIEVLIVVVIIAVLAALVLPRFIGQTERAIIAEAQQRLSAMRRGQLNWMSYTQSTRPSDVTRCGFTACDETQLRTWARIGVNPPDAGTGSYDYECSATSGSCWATRVNDPTGQYNDSTVILFITNGTFECGLPYVSLAGGRGCTGG